MKHGRRTFFGMLLAPFAAQALPRPKGGLVDVKSLSKVGEFASDYPVLITDVTTRQKGLAPESITLKVDVDFSTFNAAIKEATRSVERFNASMGEAKKRLTEVSDAQ